MPQMTISLDEYNKLIKAQTDLAKLTLECQALVKAFRYGEDWHDLQGNILNIEEMIK